jgi:putative oxidoreductase
MKSVFEFLFGGSHYESAGANFGLLLGRLGFGFLLFYLHGMGKLPPAEGFISGVANLGFPAPVFFAWMAALAESVGALMVAAGLMTRLGAFLIVINMAVAAFMRHGSDPLDVKEKALLFFFFAVIYLFAGAGKFSLDGLLFGRRQ